MRWRRGQGAGVLAAGVVAVGALLVTGTPAVGIEGAGAGSTRDASLVVRAPAGALRGVGGGGAQRFLGIPFAAPPVGALRFRRPAPPPRWKGVRDASRFAAACAQLASTNGPTSTSEDCLYLNVYRPARASRRLLPALFWIHGGSFLNGTASQFDASTLASTTGTIVVTTNYRLGVFGSLVLPSLDRESPDHASGNEGILDQQAALRWVHRNIAAFGGDRDDVTIAGQSAGGGSVCTHLASPTARGLFARAVIESGALCTAPTHANASTAGTAFAAGLGCADPATAAACLRTKDVTTLLTGPSAPPNGAVVGGAVVPSQPRAAIESGRWNRVPVLIGANHDELRVLALGAGNPGTAAGYAHALEGLFGAAAPKVAAAYPVGPAYPTPLLALGAVYSDFTLVCGTYEMETVFAPRTPTYGYEFDDPNAPPQFLIPGFSWGAYHTGEVPYLFGYATAVPLSTVQRELSAQMMRYWAAFARAGRPRVDDAARWPRYDTATTRVLSLRPSGNRVITDFGAEHHCALWHSLGI